MILYSNNFHWMNDFFSVFVSQFPMPKIFKARHPHSRSKQPTKVFRENNNPEQVSKIVIQNVDSL